MRAGMRIISQNKKTDISYDAAVIYISVKTDNHKIYVRAHVFNDDFPIGTYNTNEDAVYVMSLIQNTFMCNHKYFYMPKPEEVSVIKKKMEKCEKGGGELE